MGILAGFSCALADGIYAAVAAFGLVNISAYLFAHLLGIQVVGILYLAINGLLLLRQASRPPSSKVAPQGHKLKQLINIFIATVINPVTIVAIPAILATIGLLNHQINAHEATLIVAGIILGTTLWWVIVALLVSSQRHNVSNRMIQVINKGTGFILIACAIVGVIHITH